MKAQTPYEYAQTLIRRGYSMSSSPYEDAKNGKAVIVITKDQAARNQCQTNFYRRILGDTKNLMHEARPGKIEFTTGGKLFIVYPAILNEVTYRYLEPENTSYYIYKE